MSLLTKTALYLGGIGAVIGAYPAGLALTGEFNPPAYKAGVEKTDALQAREFTLASKYDLGADVKLDISMAKKQVNEYKYDQNGSEYRSVYRGLLASADNSYYYDGIVGQHYSTPLFMTDKQKEDRARLTASFDVIASKLPLEGQSGMAVTCTKPAQVAAFTCKVKGG